MENQLQVLLRMFAEELKPMISDIIKNEIVKLQSDNQEPEKEIITEHELSKRLRKSKPTLWAWRKKGLISYSRIGKSIFYDYNQVLKELNNYKL